MANPRIRLGELLRARRVAAGLTQDALAAAVGRTQPTVSEWESGKQIPDLSALHEISKALPGDAGELFALAAEAAAEPVTA